MSILYYSVVTRSVEHFGNASFRMRHHGHIGLVAATVLSLSYEPLCGLPPDEGPRPATGRPVVPILYRVLRHDEQYIVACDVMQSKTAIRSSSHGKRRRTRYHGVHCLIIPTRHWPRIAYMKRLSTNILYSQSSAGRNIGRHHTTHCVIVMLSGDTETFITSVGRK